MQKTKLKITNHSYRIVYLVGLLFIFSSCSLFKDLQISNIQDISPSFENKTIVLNASIDVKNSNFYNVTVKASELIASINDKELGNIELLEKVVFKRKSTGSYPLKFKMKLADGALFTILKNVFKKEVTIAFKGKIKGSALGIPKHITINETKTIDANLLQKLVN
jgi:LEA14-like dessication related protein